MAERTLSAKLGLKVGMRVLLAGLPEGVADPFADVDHVTAAAGKKVKGEFDLLLGFARDTATLEKVAPVMLAGAAEDAKVWIGYPKGTSGVQTDLNRDSGWGPMFDAGWIVVAIASVDKTWTAVRFRPKHLVKSVRFPAVC